MASTELSPARLTIRLLIFYVILFGGTTFVVTTWPDIARVFPIGGHHALETSELADSVKPDFSSDSDFEIVSTFQARTVTASAAIQFLTLHLSGTILLMIPVSWTYMGIRRDIGYQKNFVRALIVMPICATTIVLLIQDSLALAFGLAALVAAVRFRVALDEAIDGVFVFAAICVGLAAGIGYLGIAAVMTVFFCFTIVVLWHLNYGENPLDQARHSRKRAKLTQVNE